MKTKRERRGQFIIIAVLLAAMMIVSIGALLHTAVTYYKHEPWEEYSTLIGDIEVNTRRILELSLANYTNSVAGEEDANILKTNIEKWQNDLTKVYPNSGIVLTCLSTPQLQTQSWNPKAAADFRLDIMGIGLSGYEFSLASSLSLSAIQASNSTITSYTITAVVQSESGFVPNLGKANFRINDAIVASVLLSYTDDNVPAYIIKYDGTFPATVEVWDERGIHAVDMISVLS
jgi:hypothetical protein